MIQFLTYKQQKYIVLPRKTSGNCGYVDVYKKKTNMSYEHYWSLMPDSGYPGISFVDTIDDNRLFIINENGELRLYDLKKKKEIASAKIGASNLFGAGMYPSHAKGYIVTKSLESEGIDIFEIRLDSLKTSFVQTIRGVYQLTNITVLDEDQLVGYLPIGSMEGIKSSDGFLTINTKEQSHKLNYLRPSPSGLFKIPPVAFDPRTNTGIRSCFEPIEIIEDDTGRSYLAKVLLFDLRTGKKIETIVVRKFTASEMFEDDDPELALSCLDLPTYSEDYRDVKEEFLERFEALHYCHLEDAFWVTFQHGFLRKIYLDGKIHSPLIAHPGDLTTSGEQLPSRIKFDTPLRLSPDDRYLAFGSPEICISTKALENKTSEGVLLITADLIVDSECGSNSKDPDAFSWIDLNIKDTDKQNSESSYLDLLLEKTKDVNRLKDGPFFRFRFVTSEGLIKEEEFFQGLTWSDEQIRIAQEIITSFNSCDKELWYDESTPSLFYLLKRLVLETTDSLGLFIEYLRIYSDCKAEKDQLTTLIDDVVDRYGWCKETVDMILTRGYFQPEQGLEQLEYYIKQPEFEMYHGNPDHKNYLRSHTLFKTLVDEYFPMFFPNEDKLFTAIEAEDNDKVESLLKLPLELDLIHPEYNLSAFDVAVETGNNSAINLLRDAGAVSMNYEISSESGDCKPVPNQDISVEKAMRTLLSTLHRQQETIQKEIYDIQFGHMLNFSLSDEQSTLLDSKNKELEEIQSQIKYANLGLISLEDIAKSNDFENTLSIPEQNHIDGADSFISNQSYAYSDPALTIIEIEDMKEASQLYAFQRMKLLLNDSEAITFNQILRFNFSVAGRFTLENQFFEEILLTNSSAKALSNFIRSLADVISQPIWYEDEIPAGFFALQNLVLHHESFIKDLMVYLNSKIINEEEPACITELIFDVYETYGWNLSTLSLAVERLSQQNNANGLSEFRIQWKKGGLDSFIRQPEIKEIFIRLLEKHCPGDRIDWFYQFIKNEK